MENTFLNQSQFTIAKAISKYDKIFNQRMHRTQIDFEAVNTNLVLEEPLQQGKSCRCVQIADDVQSTRRNKSIVVVTVFREYKKPKF